MKKNLEVYNIPGGEWIYYKIYLGTKSADDLLVSSIHPFVKELINTNIIDQWFFIRYNDPKFHLRIRFKCNTENYGRVLNGMHNILREQVRESIVWKVQIDTYNREIERYGISTMEFSERIFFYDSMMICCILENLEDENSRWLFGLKAIDSFLDLFNFNLDEKILLFQLLSTSFRAEFGKSKVLNSAINDKYRNYKLQIADMLEDKNSNKKFYKLIGNKSKFIANDEEYKLPSKLMDKNTFNSFISSHIHMTMNRLFKSKNRAHEMVCYDFLYRYYKSKCVLQKLAINV